MRTLILLLISFTFISIHSKAQNVLPITIISDSDGPVTDSLEDEIKAEVLALLSNRFTVSFNTLRANQSYSNLPSLIERAYNQETGEIIIGVGVSTCNELVHLDSFPKPTVLTLILNNDLQNVPITDEGTSGILNLTYIQTPFNIARDFQTLYQIKPFEKLAIISGNTVPTSKIDFAAYFQRLLAPTNAEFQIIPAQGGAASVLENIGEDIDAVYVLPTQGMLANSELAKLNEGLASKGLPAFSLFNSPNLALGGYGAYESDGNVARIPRRVGLDVMKIAEGTPAADLSVAMENFTSNLIINMQTARKCKVYPTWDLLAESILINVAEISAERSLTLRTSIAEALKNNLEIHVAQKETAISEKDVSVAGSNLYPTIDASSTMLILDDNSVRTSFGTRGRYNFTANLSLTQVLFSEPVLANITIQKMLLESQKQGQRQTELDIIQTVANAYLNILQSSAIVELRNQNVNVTQKNYDIAQAKEQVGYSGTNDVYRWQSELALDNVDLNNALAQLNQARFNLNSLLNLPIKEEIELKDSKIQDSILLVMDKRLFSLINNPGELEVFADFLVEEAFRNLPELKQLLAATAAQERSLKSQNRAFYLPTFALSGSYDYPIDNFSFPEDVMPLDIRPTFSIGFTAQLPIFQGNSRKFQRDQTQVGIYQLQDQMADLRNKLELQLRGNLEVAGASFSNVELSRIAADAARKNFEITQNSYQQGLLNVTSLIDAQNAFLQAQINATNAEYTFISDFIAVERSFGYYHFLALPEEQAAFFDRFIQFITQR